MTGRHVRVAIWVATAFHGLPITSEGQAISQPASVVGNQRARIVWPRGESLPAEVADRLLRLFDEQGPLPGFPVDVLAGRRITISLATELRRDIDAWSMPLERLIILPLDGAVRWGPAKVGHVLRHEMAHVGMGLYLDHVDVPAWFDEGFAEWAAGGLVCGGEMRIRLDLMTRRRKGDGRPQLFGPDGIQRSRLSYDYLATFFDYLDGRGGGAVVDGRLLQKVRSRGVSAGLKHVFGIDLGALIDDWWADLLDRYDGLPRGFTCDPTPPTRIGESNLEVPRSAS